MTSIKDPVGLLEDDNAGLPAGESVVAGRRSVLGGLVRTARPKQWLKNLLVFAAPGAAGVLGHASAAGHALAAFAVMCVTACGVYFVNDALDVEADRQHPRTRCRPVAAGVIPVGAALAIGAALAALGLGLSPLVSTKLLVIVAVYLVVQLAYQLWLKSQPIVDMAAVASGFVLRAIAGAVAVGVPISQWFLIVATFGSLFMVGGKRLSDLRSDDGEPLATRHGVAGYSEAFLRSVVVLSASVAITAYCLWAFENVKAVTASDGHAALLFQLSIVPFTLAVLRYGLLVDQGHGGAPEEVVLGDRQLVALGLIWAAIFALGVYW
ncbi:MAG TPA: decaprenyl-phosphate phosphoribosyltransferase [Acidimicrobiales bacterium]|jgi:decaprenyl-phosphate phosphoribosyltransferase|nr:decaprenyl-phosphate phosphoribosyltransferase [Acidimicrobiales bacterium]